MSGRTVSRGGVGLCPPHRAPPTGAPDPHQLAAIAALAHRLRLASAGRRTDSLSLALATLEATLNAIEVPAFVLDQAGVIVHGNAQGRVFLDEQRALVTRSLDRTLNGEPAELAWRLTDIGGVDAAPWHLAVLGTPLPASGDKRALAAAVVRWRLTTRQRQVLELVALGLTNADIGLGLEIGESTVEFHLSAIFDKVGVDNRATLIARLLAP